MKAHSIHQCWIAIVNWIRISGRQYIDIQPHPQPVRSNWQAEQYSDSITILFHSHAIIIFAKKKYLFPYDYHDYTCFVHTNWMCNVEYNNGNGAGAMPFPMRERERESGRERDTSAQQFNRQNWTNKQKRKNFKLDFIFYPIFLISPVNAQCTHTHRQTGVRVW